MPTPYIARNPRPNLLDEPPESVARALQHRMACRRDRFYCLVRESGRVFLRPTTERRQPAFKPGEWVGTYTQTTPREIIVSDLRDRLRELTQQAA